MSHKVTAKGRGGIVNVRTGHFKDGEGFAVDAKMPNSKREAARKGLIFRFFATRDEAKAFADLINAGNHPKLGKAATNAIVVKALNAEDAPWLMEETTTSTEVAQAS
jgi:hypothetical protein